MNIVGRSKKVKNYLIYAAREKKFSSKPAAYAGIFLIKLSRKTY